MNHGPTSHAGLMVSRSGKVEGPWDLVNVSRDPSTGVTRHFLDDQSPGTGGRCEDEDLYRDHRGYLHLISHCFCKIVMLSRFACCASRLANPKSITISDDKFPGGHGWTTDKTGASGWEFSQQPAYTFAAHLNGQDVRLGQRERPQVVLQNGQLTHLYNGARGPKGNPNPDGDTFNMVTEICSKGPAVGGVCP